MATIKITGLGHGIGSTGEKYSSAIGFSSSTITFAGDTFDDIRREVWSVANSAMREAKRAGLKGRNYISSPAIAIANKVDRAVEAELAKAASS